MPVQKKKTIRKNKAKKFVAAGISIVLIIAVAASVFITVVTRPVDEKDENAVAVGGMLTSDTVDFKSESAAGLEKDPVIKIMQMVWRFVYDSDMKKHEDQTPPEVTEIRDIPYLDDANRYHLLDVYYPREITDSLPVIIDIHGGGWMYADKGLNEYYCKSLADRGFVVFNISYRLVPDVTVNEQIQDVACALKWIGENMKNYPCDSESIMLTGDSAGGQLAVYSAVLLQSRELREIFDTVDGGMDVDALLLTSPVPNMKSGLLSVYTKKLWGLDYKEKATYDYMDLDEIVDYAQLPPTYLITSSGDSMAHDQTVAAAELLESRGVEVVLRDYEKFEGKSLPHVFSILEPFDEIGTQAIDDAVAFYRDIIEAK